MHVSMSYLYFSRIILHNKLKIWEMKAHQNESSPQKYFMLIHMVLFSYIFLLMWQFKTLIECFLSNQFDEIKYVLFCKNWIQRKCFKFCCLYYQIYLIQPWRYSDVSRGKFGHTSTMERFDLFIQKQYFVIHLNRQADTGIHKVFNSIILSEMLKLNVWEDVDTLTLKIWLNSWCCFAPVFL